MPELMVRSKSLNESPNISTPVTGSEKVTVKFTLDELVGFGLPRLMDKTTGQVLFCQSGTSASIKAVTDGSVENRPQLSVGIVREVMFVIEAGASPPRLLFAKRRISNFVRFPNSAGMVPVRRLHPSTDNAGSLGCPARGGCYQSIGCRIYKVQLDLSSCPIVVGCCRSIGFRYPREVSFVSLPSSTGILPVNLLPEDR